MEKEKLTLRLEKELIEKAKRHAREHETSVSGMVAGFFDRLDAPTGETTGRITARLRGSLKPSDDRHPSDEADYRDHLEEKHG